MKCISFSMRLLPNGQPKLPMRAMREFRDFLKEKGISRNDWTTCGPSWASKNYTEVHMKFFNDDWAALAYFAWYLPDGNVGL